jgi:hypothetical protein
MRVLGDGTASDTITSTRMLARIIRVGIVPSETGIELGGLEPSTDQGGQG